MQKERVFDYLSERQQEQVTDMMYLEAETVITAYAGWLGDLPAFDVALAFQLAHFIAADEANEMSDFRIGNFAMRGPTVSQEDAKTIAPAAASRLENEGVVRIL